MIAIIVAVLIYIFIGCTLTGYAAEEAISKGRRELDPSEIMISVSLWPFILSLCFGTLIYRWFK